MIAACAALRANRDAEFLHDARVALRRLRSLLSQLVGVLEPTLCAELGTELRWLAGCTGPARDLDTLMMELRLTEPALRTELAPVLAALEVERARQQVELLAQLDSARRSALPGTELFTNRKHCPLLVAQACGVYAVRPIPCRALLSLSSQACQLALEENKGQVPVIATAMNKGEMVRTMLLAAVGAAGLADRGIELNAGVTTAMNMPDAEARWLAGENIFDGLLGAERMLSSRGAQDHIAKLIRVLVD